jgi:hypothetical protein
MPNDHVPLLLDAQHALGGNQAKLGESVGVSRRTVQRWMAARAVPTSATYHALARVVLPADREIARRLATAGGTTLAALGLEVLTPPLPPPPQASPRHLADSLVCAAAEALDVPPAAIRPALLVAFARAREMGLSIADAEAALRSATPKGKSA